MIETGKIAIVLFTRNAIDNELPLKVKYFNATRKFFDYVRLNKHDSDKYEKGKQFIYLILDLNSYQAQRLAYFLDV